MPWCPICKNEYKEGIEVCADCNAKLVDKLVDKQVVIFVGDEKQAEALVGFLEVNGYKDAIKNLNTEDFTWEVLVFEQDVDKLRPAMKSFLREVIPMLNEVADSCDDECEEEASDEIEESTVDTSLNADKSRYEKPIERAEEYKSGAATLLIVGILGAILLVLADMGIIPYHMSSSGKLLINIVMGGMFLLFIILGIKSISSYKKLLIKAQEDEELEKKINEWFSANVSKEDIIKNDNDKVCDEALFFSRIKNLSDLVKNNFPDAEDNFVDYIVEKLYADLFEDK